MRILQIIDSLDIGGAEKMAVLYANELAQLIDKSVLVSTRKEGGLKKSIAPNVSYHFLNRQGVFDFNALKRLVQICKKEQVTHIHAHGTSIFFGSLAKMFLPKVQLIFHDHFGSLQKRQVWKYRLTTFKANFCIAVNEDIASWNQKNLKLLSFYLPNFSIVTNSVRSDEQESNFSFKILALANFRKEKGHEFLFQIAQELKLRGIDVVWQLYGRVSDLEYYQHLRALREQLELTEVVEFFENESDVTRALQQADVAVLTSSFEGLPLAVIEYGLAGKAVVLTKVGACETLVQSEVNGFVVPYGDAKEFADKIEYLYRNPDKRGIFGERLHDEVSRTFSAKAVMSSYLQLLEKMNDR
ncbi:glycosyltransferase [Flavobacterium sp.]|uniref:glycosyltransferase n=1 Tax=Flavobacterium sp. TaxID=239 RepID=UPI00260DB217|nr:glycosyltransferase [Flavobacterium sp.]